MTDILSIETITPELAAEAGAKVLDQVASGIWFNQIDLDNLDMGGGDYLPAAYDAHENGTCGCMMAQLNWDGNVLGSGKPDDENGDYWDGREILCQALETKLSVDEFAVYHGFDIPTIINEDMTLLYLNHNPDAILDGVGNICMNGYYSRLDAAWTAEILKRRNSIGS